MFEPSTELVEAIVSRAGGYLRILVSDPWALRGQQLRGGGAVAEFEGLLAEMTGFPYCLATSNATSALLVAALALDLDQKIVAVEHGAWVGSLGALEAAGAEILEVDSLVIAPLEEISAVLATDRPGRRHDAELLRKRCAQWTVTYIEDTGWLPGITAPKDQRSLADVQVVSFGPGKPFSLGEGGALLCREESLYEAAVALGQHPERAIAEGIHGIERPPLNARIHPIAAVLGAWLLREAGEGFFASLPADAADPACVERQLECL